MKVIFECIDKKSGARLNHVKYNKDRPPGYCFGMAVDWVKTSLKFNGVKSIDWLDPFKWPIIQSAYEMNENSVKRAGRGGTIPEIKIINANGLDVVNGNGQGGAVEFNHDFKELARQLAGKVGTHIFILFGPTGAGAHFMAFRRKGVGEFLLAEFFDPNDAMFSFNSEKDFEEFLSSYLDHMYNGKHELDPVLNEYCGLSTVALA